MMSCLPDDQDDHNVKMKAAAMLEWRGLDCQDCISHNDHFLALKLTELREEMVLP